MSGVLLLALVIGLGSFYGAAYLLSLWHDDRATGTTGWPLSRVLAYLAIAGTLASNLLSAVSVLRLANVSDFRDIQLALTPLTLTALLVLDAIPTVLALYLRAVRATGYMTPQIRAGLATEASVQDAIAAAKEAYHEANTVNNKIADLHAEVIQLTTSVAGKEDKA